MSDLGDLYPEGGDSAILHYRAMAARTRDCAGEVDNMWKQIRSKSTNCTDHDKIQLFDKAFEDYETRISDFTRLEQDFDKLNTHLVTTNGIDLVERDMKVIIANSDDGSKHEMHVSNYHSLKGVLKSYAEDFSIPVNTCRLIYKGKMIFLSQSGKKTMMALGIEDGDVIQIGINHFREDNTTHSSAKGASVKSGSKKNNKISKVKGSKKNKSKSTSTFLAKLEPTLQDYKDEHSIKQSRVFDEMRRHPMYKNTRQKLNDMSLQKSGPKKRSSKTTAEGKENATNAVFVVEDFLGGKAGKTAYPILVSGGKEYLYKSSKPRHHRNGQHLGKTPSSVRMTVDLHGHSKDEAIEKLNKSLTKWVVKAMKGADPWVIPVDIICGGGNQVLSETVAQWIRENPKVANRPKGIWCLLP